MHKARAILRQKCKTSRRRRGPGWAIRDEGLLTATVVAQELGLGPTTLYRLEGKLFGPAARRGKRRIRVFTPEQVEQIRQVLRQTTRLGTEPELLPL